MAPVVNVGKNKAFSNGIATQADDAKYKAKYKELKEKILEIEQDNTKLSVKVLKSKKAIQRLRLERAILYDRLQTSATPTNPFSLHTAPHLSSLPPPPTILSTPNYPLSNPSAQDLYLKELDARKLRAVQYPAGEGSGGDDTAFAARPNVGVATSVGGSGNGGGGGRGGGQQDDHDDQEEDEEEEEDAEEAIKEEEGVRGDGRGEGDSGATAEAAPAEGDAAMQVDELEG